VMARIESSLPWLLGGNDSWLEQGDTRQPL
jgi:hypothetical protein